MTMPPNPLFAGVDRRGLMRCALLLGGAMAADSPGLARALRPPAARFLDPARFAALDAFAATLIPNTETPGAREVGVPAMVDVLLTGWASEARRAEFRRLFDEMDAAARDRNRRPLAALPAPDQLAVVMAYDASRMTDAAYLKLKAVILTLYYHSEAGATQELRYEHAPGAYDPIVPVTPETRAWAVDVAF